MKLKNYFMVLLVFLGTLGLQAQQGPTSVETFDGMTYVPSLASRSSLLPAVTVEREMPDGRMRASWIKSVAGKGYGYDPTNQTRDPYSVAGLIPTRGAEFSFTAAFTSSSPTDPSGALGPNHYFAVFNTGFRIFEKDGTPLTGQLSPLNIFPASGCCDLTVSYDNAADRWVVTFLGGGAQVAVSDGPDPVNDGWFVYNVSTINDYQKLSVWSDGYYITDNNSNPSRRITAMERDAMLAGDPGAQIITFGLPDIATNGFYSPQAFNVSTSDLPASGSLPVVFMQDDAFSGVDPGNDHIGLWEIDVDWVSPGSSTVSAKQEIPLAPFTSVFDGGSFSNLPQPLGGAVIDAIQSTIMNQAQFRKFPGYNSAIFNFVEDADPTSGKLAAIRWIELRQTTDGAPWTLFQEGTYIAPDGKHAWMGSMIMDNQGNIGMGYMSMSGPTTPTTIRVSSYYTGRFSSDAAGDMTVAETLIEPGTGNLPNFRAGDYSKIDVDPVDDQTFYFNNEQVISGGRANVVGVFKLAPDADNDVGVVSIVQPADGTLSSTETVEVIVRNFGALPQSDVPVSFSVDGGAAINEVITGPIAPATNVTYTFTATADLGVVGTTYTIAATTGLVGDEFPANDGISKDVTYLEPDDVGVTALVAPVSGSGLLATETVTIEITNFGGETQTSIPVSYAIDGGTPVAETWTGTLATGESTTYDFTATADLSDLGDYEFISTTILPGDADTSNDANATTVSNVVCQPEGNCEGFGDGVTMLQLADQDITVSCNSTGYADDTDITFSFDLGDNPFAGVLQMGWVDSSFAIWIDFNDNAIFEPTEVVEFGNVPTPDTDFPFEIDFSVLPGVTLGDHLMRVRGEDTSGDGNVLDPCDDLQFGRTNDYIANISGVLGVEEQALANADLIISSTDNNIFDVAINNSQVSGDLNIEVHNVMGQLLVSNMIQNNGGTFNYSLDMSFVPSGVYLVRVGNGKYGKVKRIIVE